MLDCHSHLLPGVDDGSRSIEESIQLLTLLKQQGVDAVIATPHFYADEQSVQQFLDRRQTAYAELTAALPDAGLPAILLGAEVRYYHGIARLQDLRRLCVEGTRVLLLEMPMTRWSGSTVREILEIANTKNVTLVLAHIERYVRLQPRTVWDQLLENGVLMQVNASYFNDRRTRRKALRRLADGEIHLLGSDCHGVRSRPPAMNEAMAVIRKRLDETAITRIGERAERLFLTHSL